MDEDVIINDLSLLFKEPTNPAHDVGVERTIGGSRLKDHSDDRALYADSEEGSVRKRAVPVVYRIVVITDHRI